MSVGFADLPLNAVAGYGGFENALRNGDGYLRPNVGLRFGHWFYGWLPHHPQGIGHERVAPLEKPGNGLVAFQSFCTGESSHV